MKLFFLSIIFSLFLLPSANAQQWQMYTTANSNNPDNSYIKFAIDNQNHKWFLNPNSPYFQTVHYDGDTTWTIHDNTYLLNPSILIYFQCNKLEVDREQVVWQIDANSAYSLKDGLWTRHTGSSSGIPAMYGVRNLAIDSDNIKWFATSQGLVKYYDSVFTFISDTPSLPLNAIGADRLNNVWTLTNDSLLCYNEGTWYSFPIPFPVTSIHLNIKDDSEGNIWIGHNTMGLYKWDGNTWTNYNTFNSSIPTNGTSHFFIDDQDNIWLSYMAGLAKYNGSSWTIFDVTTGYPGSGGGDIDIDDFGNIWALSGNGVVVFNENGVGLETLNSEMAKMGLYPNPSSAFINLEFRSDENESIEFSIFSITGQKMQTITRSVTNGLNDISFDISFLSSGSYFIQAEVNSIPLSKQFIKY